MEFARKLCSNYGFHILAPFPGTEVRDSAEKYGIRILTSDWDRYDANQSVCESVSLPHQEVDRIVNDFNEGSNRNMMEAIQKSKRGETLSEENRILMNKLNSFTFSLKLVNEELVERYFQQCADGKCMSPFAEFVTEHSGFEKKMVENELDRLFRLGCLSNSMHNGTAQISWT
jgi:hypothetical protein